jgi:hypothetical protein
VRYSLGAPIKQDEEHYMKKSIIQGYHQILRDMKLRFTLELQESGVSGTILMIRGNYVVTVNIGDTRAIM